MNDDCRSATKIRITTLEIPPDLLQKILNQYIEENHHQVTLNWLHEKPSKGFDFQTPDPSILAAIIGASATIISSIIAVAANFIANHHNNKKKNIALIIKGKNKTKEHRILFTNINNVVNELHTIIENESELEIQFDKD